MVDETTPPEEEVIPEGEEPTPDPQEGGEESPEETTKQKRKKFFENLPPKKEEKPPEPPEPKEEAKQEQSQVSYSQFRKREREVERFCEDYPGLLTDKEKDEIIDLATDERAMGLTPKAVALNYIEPERLVKYGEEKAAKLAKRGEDTKTGDQAQKQNSGRLSAKELDQKMSTMSESERATFWATYRRDVLGYR